MDEARLHEFVGKMLGDMGAAVSGALIIIGDRLGLFKSLAAGDGQTAEELAKSTGTDERYVREWTSAMAASGYIHYDVSAETFSMDEAQQAVFADDNSPFRLTGGYYSISSVYQDEPKVSEAFKTGGGISWGDHSQCLFCGVEKFFRPGYAAYLADEWLPSLDGVTDKLSSGARVADVGCGHGASTIVMAKAFPNSEFFGFDLHDKSIECARKNAEEAGVSNVRFEKSLAKEFPGNDYDLVCFFDCLHDMGDPAGAMRHARQALEDDGSVMIVEPFAQDELKDNLNPVGRLYYSFSATVCVPTSLSQEVGAALGAQAGEKRLRAVAEEGGFSSFRRATETPFNLILEARK